MTRRLLALHQLLRRPLHPTTGSSLSIAPSSRLSTALMQSNVCRPSSDFEYCDISFASLAIVPREVRTSSTTPSRVLLVDT